MEDCNYYCSVVLTKLCKYRELSSRRLCLDSVRCPQYGFFFIAFPTFVMRSSDTNRRNTFVTPNCAIPDVSKIPIDGVSS